MKFIRLFAVTVVVLSCSSPSHRAENLDATRGLAAAPFVDPYLRNGYGIMPGIAPSCALTCDELELWAGVRPPRAGEESAVGHPQTIAQLLRLLRERRPEYMSHHTFAYESFSLHGASFGNPRAVVFGCDAKTILTFNGSKLQKGYERLEVSCFNESRKTFDFKEYTFPAEAKRSEDLADLTERERLQPVVVSPIDGTKDRKCSQCHGTPNRPIWESYNVWPRFYGSLDDNMSRSRHEGYAAWENAKWASFNERNRWRGRYDALPPRKLGRGDSDRPNDEIGISLYYLNGERIVAELKRLGQKFERQKYKFAHALICTQPSARGNYSISEQTSARSKQILMANYEGVLDKINYMRRTSGISDLYPTRAEAARRDDYFENRFGRWFPDHQFPFVARGNLSDDYDYALSGDAAAALEKIMIPLGVDIRNWSLSLHGGYAYSSGQSDFFLSDLQSMLERPFLMTFLRQDPEVTKAILDYRGLEWEYNQDNSIPIHENAFKNMCNLLSRRTNSESI